jgi:hypothetical protein
MTSRRERIDGRDVAILDVFKCEDRAQLGVSSIVMNWAVSG